MSVPATRYISIGTRSPMGNGRPSLLPPTGTFWTRLRARLGALVGRFLRSSSGSTSSPEANDPRSPSPPIELYRRADDGDIWFRHLIEGRKNTLNRDPKQPVTRLKVRYVIDSFQEPLAERPWALELSGRMLNLCSADIREKAMTAA